MPGRVEIDVRGNINIHRLDLVTQGAVDDALDAGLEVMKYLANGLTPYRTGTLRAATGTARETRTMGRLYNTADYAVFVHEDLEAEHLIGGPKFFEKVIKNGTYRKDILTEMARAIQVHFS